MHIAECMDKVAKVEAVRCKASSIFFANRILNHENRISLILAISALPQFDGLEFQRRYTLLNRVLSKIEQKGGETKWEK